MRARDRDDHPSMALVRERLAATASTAEFRRDGAWAATALVLHDHAELGPEALFIERARRRGDRWSGQMALPGGRRDPTDADLVTTARREAAEEVGIALGEPLGRLPDLGSRSRGGRVATVAFEVPRRPPLVLEAAEVARAVWIPVAHLLDPVNAAVHRHRGIGGFNSIVYDEHVVWGLTLGILGQFATLLDRRLPHA